MIKIINLIQLIRPKQWLKNLFVFAAIIFAGQLLNLNFFLKNFVAFLAFCGVSGLVYIINDITDIEADRVHKKKRFRPLASGEVSINQAKIFFVILAVITAVLCYSLNLYFSLIVIAYFFINLLYSLWVKDIVIVDVFFISFGFMLRVVGGAAAISVSISSWMILTTIFISLFLAISKRRAELSQVDSENLNKQRKVLTHYDIAFADQMNTVAATGTIICYALYTVSEKTTTTFHTDNLIYTTPFVIYGIFRYLYLLHKKNLGENPEQIVTKDIPLIIDIILWFIVSVAIIYKQKFFHI
ncbi:MAG: decaprenyl-phosphate phosphoribosyltransferase [Ignavibacteriae bacterium]|nr:decaprenyl-phosphate phosphoribosyltransferase [Ignavibacteriota bacterium]